MIVDLVPNHTSSEHPWFQAALAAGPGSPERARYLFRDGRGEDGASRRTTGSRSSAARRGRGSRTASGTSTSSTAPSPTSTGATPRCRRCSRTCSGSGSTAASTASGSTWPTACSRRPSLPDAELPVEPAGQSRPGRLDGRAPPGDEPMWDHPEVHDVYRQWRQVLDEYDGERMAVAEAWAPDAGVDGALRASRRAAPDVQLPLAARRRGRRPRSRRSSPTPSPRWPRSARPRPGC